MLYVTVKCKVASNDAKKKGIGEMGAKGCL